MIPRIERLVRRCYKLKRSIFFFALLQLTLAQSFLFQAPTTFSLHTQTAFPHQKTFVVLFNNARGLSTDSDQILSILQQNQYMNRVVTLQQNDLPVTAELLINGECRLANITKILFLPISSTDIDSNAPAKIQFSLQDGTKVDAGQITTVWTTTASSTAAPSNRSAKKLSPHYIERALESIHRSRVGRGRKGGLSKQQLSQYSDATQTQAILRHIMKGGLGQSRVVDSQQLQQQSARLLSQKECATLLAQDAQTGGRFKRWPCVLLAHESTKQLPSTITLMNGGWLVMDQNVRATTDGLLFVQRQKVQTVTDERIALRLECLALGERQQQPKQELELDVRQVLLEMNLSLDAQGAKNALVQLGLWTSKDGDNSQAQFWTPSVLDAAKEYVRELEASQLRGEADDERIDLRNLPCLCVDGQRVSFRDDAIGLRTRASTGRKFFPEASQWELLLHIADVSDIYVPKDETTVHLRQAAASRGSSRYDLPTGPIHLLPPVVLNALSLGRSKENRCVTVWAYVDERNGRLLDAGVERTRVAPPHEYSFTEATRLMEKGTSKSTILKDNTDDKARAILLVTERILNAWSQARQSRSVSAKKREERMKEKETEFQKDAMFDDGRDGFVRTRAHRVVDSALDLYSYAAAGLLRRAESLIPRAQGAGADRGGRIATSPLRRFLDGEAQRQLLAVGCNFGKPLSAEECREAGKLSNEMRNKVNSIRSLRKKSK